MWTQLHLSLRLDHLFFIVINNECQNQVRVIQRELLANQMPLIQQ
jgi:hypothetical protein